LVSKSQVSVITICSLSHADVWRLTSNLLPRFVEADNYFVYVPESELNEFSRITNPQIQILSQDLLGKNYFAYLKNKVDSIGNQKRFGWYLQQFYKIEALINANSSHLVIWDADCVPVKKITLFDSSGAPVYMLASEENHRVYFETIRKLLDLEKVQQFSFVIPGFPILKTWISQFIEDLESKHKIPWYESIIHNTPLGEASGFSETETLGTWVANSYPASWSTIPGNWERHGQRRFGYARDFDLDAVVKLGKRHDLDIISFENWDSRRRVVRLKKLLTKLISRVR
jgi:hypothetical protein